MKCLYLAIMSLDPGRLWPDQVEQPVGGRTQRSTSRSTVGSQPHAHDHRNQDVTPLS
jgi:hypothetical protein